MLGLNRRLCDVERRGAFLVRGKVSLQVLGRLAERPHLEPERLADIEPPDGFLDLHSLVLLHFTARFLPNAISHRVCTRLQTRYATTAPTVVGYAKKGLFANKFAQVGAQFQNIKDGTLLLDETISGLPGVDFDDKSVWKTTAPQIQIVQADGNPLVYYYINDGWYDNGTKDGDTKPGWVDGRGDIVDLTITPGAGFWLWNTNSEDQEMNGAGQIEGQASDDAPVAGGIFSINANIFPETIDLNDASKVAFTDIVGVDFDDKNAWKTTAPQIQIVQADGNPLVYYYINDGWYDNGTKDGDTKPGWVDGRGDIAEVVIAAQSGFWLWAKTGAFTITYKK